MNEQQKSIINRVILTLNGIDVRGRQNLDALLGCIIALENLERMEVDNGRQNDIVSDSGDSD